MFLIVSEDCSHGSNLSTVNRIAETGMVVVHEKYVLILIETSI